MSPGDDGAFQRRMQRVESLVEKAERFADPEARSVTREIVAALLELHAAGLGRVLELAGPSATQTFAADGLVASLLLLHGMHPVDFETRVCSALDSVRPLLRSHGGGVELLGVADGVVRLRLGGSCHGCPSSAQTLRDAIESALYEAAPDLAALEVEGVGTAPALSVSRLIALPLVESVR